MKKTRYTEKQLVFILKQAETAILEEKVASEIWAFRTPLFTSMDYLHFASTEYTAALLQLKSITKPDIETINFMLSINISVAAFIAHINR